MSIEAAPEAARPYARQGSDRVRQTFECSFFGRLLPGLLEEAGGSALLDLGCGDGLARRLAGPRVERYLGLDLAPPPVLAPHTLCHDLRDGLGPVGATPFDLYLGSFGLASHLAPQELQQLLLEIAAHARRGALVALEALGLHSLEWPRLWDLPAGAKRRIPYRLGADVLVHPWSPDELFGLFEAAGIRPLRALDRTLQAGPKLGVERYWRGLPPVRAALNALLAGAAGPEQREILAAELPPLPAGHPAALHHELARRRRELVGRHAGPPARLARSVWRLEPLTRGGYGHGLLVVGRVS